MPAFLNPMEKLCHLLKQEIQHLYRWADNLQQLRERMVDFLQQFTDGLPELLHTVGLDRPDDILNVHKERGMRWPFPQKLYAKEGKSLGDKIQQGEHTDHDCQGRLLYGAAGTGAGAVAWSRGTVHVPKLTGSTVGTGNPA